MNEIVIPGYTLKRTLGRGGMATVYLAEQDKFERDVALKVMAPALSADAGFRERFLREAKIVAKISHPNIVAVYDVNEVNGIYYIAMEFHPGGDLKARIRDGLDVASALRITRDVARALDFAHSRGYLHRDIKPDNILFRADGSAVLTDFGIAKATEGDASLTQMGMVAGTPKYMSPEQARAQALDADSDLYSLGVVLFEMLTGRLPYEAADPIALGIMHMNAPIPRLEGRLAHFQPLIDRLLAKQPGQRPQTGAQLIREIDALEKTFDFGAASEPVASDTVLRPAVRRGDAGAVAAPAGKAAPVADTAAPAGASAPAVPSAADATVVAPALAATRAPAPAPQAATPAAPATPVPGKGKLAAAALALAVALGGGWWSLQHSAADATARKVTAQLDAGAAALARQELVSPAEDNALAHYRSALALAPGNAAAQEGIRKVVAALQAQAYAALAGKRLDDAQRLLAQASEIDPSEAGNAPLLRAIEEARSAQQAVAATSAPVAPAPVAVRQERRAELRAALRDLREEAVAAPAATAPDQLARLRIGGMLGSARRALDDGDVATAIQRYEQVLKLDPGNREARDGLREARAR